MYTNIKKAGCGDCGNQTFHIYGTKGETDKLIAECTSCKNTSVITITAPKIDIQFGEDSKGIISFYE